MAKKILSFLIIFSMTMGIMPWQDIQSFAYDPEKYYVDHVAITKIYKDGAYDVSETKLTIQGRYLKGIEVSTFTSTGTVVLTNPVVNFETVQEFIVKGDIVGDSIIVGNTNIPIMQNALPTLLSVDKRSAKIGEDDITFTGSNLNKIKEDPSEPNAVYSAYFQNTAGGGGEYYIDKTLFNAADKVTIPKEDLRGVAGPQNMVLKKEAKTMVKFHDTEPDEREVKITIQNTYLNQFTLVDNIIVENLVMNPNRGRPGDEVLFMATSGLDHYDVFFLEKLNDRYSSENKGTATTFDPDIDGKQILTTHVPPNLVQGEYYVVLTNKIPPGVDPEQAINKMLIVGEAPNFEKFTVIDAEQKIQVLSVEPDKGPDSGSKVELSGVFFGTLNTPKFIPDNPAQKDVSMVQNQDETNMLITYSKGRYNGIDVISATRTIKVIIGGVAKFAKNAAGTDYEYNFTDSIDRMSVITPSITDADTDPVKDVIVETVTTFKLDGFPNDIVIKDRAELKDGYTFILSKMKPKIDHINPEKIQVTKISDTPITYQISEQTDRMIGIYGENFFIHKYTDDSGKEVVRYPIIEFGNGVRLNKNDTGLQSNPELYLKIFDKQGKELDGSEGNEMGSKILVKIPKDKTMETIGKTAVKIINPVRNSTEEGLYANKPDAVEFVVPPQNKRPVIESVVPNVVTVGGGETVVITGSNFQEGVKVMIDGEEVKGIKLQGDGKKIELKAPSGREGETQLQVINPEGGIAIHPFIYVKTYTDPKLLRFSPKSGKTGTLVVLEGENFLKPDPTATKEDIYKFIGTRVLLEGIDINGYNQDDITKKIVLVHYKAPNAVAENEIGKLLRIVNSKLKLEEYYHSVILENKSSPGKYYTIDRTLQNKIILSNGSDQKYTFSLDSGKIKADKEGGGVYTVTVEEDDTSDILKLVSKSGTDTLELRLMTPFKVEDGIIVGDRVKVLDMYKLYFTVPILPGDGYYDVTVKNPDTKKDSKVDSEGFYYYTQPNSRPSIETIDPNEGSVNGGYKITIYGKKVDGRECFIDNSTEKTRISINGTLVPDKDVTVGTDGTTLEVVVPKLNIDIQEEYKTDRLTVPIVVVNPDGGSASKEDGFTYVVPISHPKIYNITPVQGKAAGGNYVEITGDDFRFYEPYKDVDRSEAWELGEEYTDLNNYSIKNDKEDDGTQGPDDFTGEKVDVLKEKYQERYKDIVLPVLPKVYFDGKPAEVVEFDNGYLKVVAPKGKAGTADVYVTNNDSGISNKVIYTYQSSAPQITNISPTGGKKQGRDRVEIHGKDFFPSDVTIVYKDGDNYKTKEVSQTLVRFDQITNQFIARDQENSGRIDNSRTSVRLEGGLSIAYDGGDETLKIGIIENQENYSVTLPYQGEILYVPVSLLTYRDSAGEVHSYVNANKGDEWIRFEISDRRLFVERGYAPEVEYLNSSQIVVHTPSYYTVGVVPMTIINPDAGEVSSTFEYKNPDSDPKITNVTKDGKNPVLEKMEEKQVRLLKASYKGGNIISVLGTDFRENATIQIGEILKINPQDITYQLPNKLTFTMPSVGEEHVGKLFRVVVSNEDYGNAASDELAPPIYIQFTKGETGPAIESVTPDKGSSSGGTTVIIKGKDFRENLSVYIGESMVPKENVQLIDYKTVKIVTSPHEPGIFEVKIENPDGEISDPKGQFTYLSAPQIVSVVDPEEPTESSVIDVISVEGGQRIKIKGSGFLEGARIVFAPSIEKAEKEEQGEFVYIKGEPYKVLEGIDGIDVEFLDEGTLIVKTPSGKLETKGIIVINPDGGATDIYESIRYGIPELPAPTGVIAEVVYDRYIKVTWNKIEDAQEYEIHVVVNDRDKYFVDSTELTHFVYEDLEPRTRYQFVVTAIGKFGGSKYSEESNEVKTGSSVGPEDKDGELGEKTKIERNGNNINVHIGEDDYDEMMKIDLTRGELAGAREVIVYIPAYVAARHDAKDIAITGQDFHIQFNPKTFYSERVRENKNNRDAGVRFVIQPKEAMTAMGLSKEYILKASVYVGKDHTEMTYLPSYVRITLDVDRAKADLRKAKKIYLGYYDEDTQQWLSIANGNAESYAVTGLSEKLGRFSIIGSRR
ncbi:IPT/TIG domain-containing protein [Clostridiaceae bacterium 35-E11]